MKGWRKITCVENLNLVYVKIDCGNFSCKLKKICSFINFWVCLTVKLKIDGIKMWSVN